MIRVRLIGPIAVLLCLGATVAASPHDPKAQAVLDQCVAAMKALASFRERITVKVTNPDLLLAPLPQSVEVRFQKPNRFRVEVLELRNSRAAKRVLTCDGKSVRRWVSGGEGLKTEPAPKSLGELTDLPNVSPELLVLWTGAFDFKDWPAANVTLNLGNPEKIGDEEVNVIQGDLSAPGLAGGGSVRLFISKKDHLIRGLTMQFNGKDESGKEITGKIELLHEIKPAAPMLAADFLPPPAPPAKTAAGRAK